MKTSLHKSAIKEETKPASESTGDEESCVEEIFLQVGTGKEVQDDDRMKPPSPNHNNLNYSKLQGLTTRSSPESESRSSSSAKREQVDDQLLGSAKAEMDEVMEENQRLKMYLDRILKDYRTLQMQYRDVIQQEAAKRTPQELAAAAAADDDQIIDLSLGMSSSSNRSMKNDVINVDDDKQELGLGLDCSRFDLTKKSSPAPPSPSDVASPENSVEETTKEAMKNVHGRDGSGGEADEATQNPAKRARVSVRVRCDTPTMNDGCQWRKYGQKIAKGNPCPRAYYRCTVAPSCPVRKQVQRCAEDMSILITTYEGTHNHPLPMSATAMASTTSAAASMLLSGSSTSGTAPGSSSTVSANPTGTLNGLNFYLSDNSRPKPFYLPNSSISSSPSFPTITLDLTSSSSSNLNRLGSFPPRYSSTNLNFSSLESNPPPISWNNGMLSYGSSQPLINKNQATNSLTFGSQSPYETLYQSYLQKTTSNPNPNPSQHSLPSDTLAAATKAITSDPSFQSALAAALSSIINGASSTTPSNQNAGEKSSNSFPILSSFPSSSNANKCAPNFMNKSSSSTSSQSAGLMHLSPPFPFSNSKSKSNSPSDNRDHTS